MRDSRKALSHICCQMEAELVQQQDEGLGLKARLLLLVPGNNGDGLVEIYGKGG